MYPEEAKDTNVYKAEPEPTLIQRFEALNNHVASAPECVAAVRLVELGDTAEEFTSAIPPSIDACPGADVLRLRRRLGYLSRAIDQLGAAVATRDGYGCSMSDGPDVEVQHVR